GRSGAPPNDFQDACGESSDGRKRSMALPTKSLRSHLRISIAAGFASKQHPSSSRIRIASRTFWKIEKCSRSAFRNSTSAPLDCYLKSRMDRIARQIGRTNVAPIVGNSMTFKCGKYRLASKDRKRRASDQRKLPRHKYSCRGDRN